MTSNNYAMVFPGQGSQKIGMLKQMAQAYPQILDTFTQASHTLGYDVWDLTQNENDAKNKLNQTIYTQPALLTASVALWRLWRSLQPNQLPNYVLGHSLGEYSALVAAEVLSFTDALNIVAVRGQAMQNAVPIDTGGMLVVLGLQDELVQQLCLEVNNLSINKTIVEPANYNFTGQIVVAGHNTALQQLSELVKQNNGKVMVLPVSIPSHCSLMQPAQADLNHILKNTTFNNPIIPVIHNSNATTCNEVSQIKTLLLNQLTLPVQWVKSMQFLNQQGISTLVECGAGNVLSNLAKRMTPTMVGYPIEQPMQLDTAITNITHQANHQATTAVQAI